MKKVEIGSRWRRSGYSKKLGPYNGYTVLAVTNVENLNSSHPPQVVYKGDNGKTWSLPLAEWPGKLISEESFNDHVFYRIEDFMGANGFLEEQIKRLVCDRGLSICIFCSAAESEMEEKCEYDRRCKENKLCKAQ